MTVHSMITFGSERVLLENMLDASRNALVDSVRGLPECWH